MGMRRAHEHGMRHIGKHNIVAIAAPPDQQPQIFLAPHRLADPGAVHRYPHLFLPKAAGWWPSPGCLAARIKFVPFSPLSSRRKSGSTAVVDTGLRRYDKGEVAAAPCL